MYTIIIKNTTVVITCDDLEELYKIYFDLRHNRTLAVNGIELEPGIIYTRSWFQKNL